MFFTQNPIGSSATEDLQDNAISFDYAMNSPAALWQDRFGKQHKTVQQALKDVGFKPAGFDFVSGGTLGIGDRDKCVFYPTDGYWYSWNGKLPYVVPANSSPTPGGKKGWGVIDKSANTIGYRGSESAPLNSVFSKLQESVSFLDYIPKSEHPNILKGISDYDCTSAIQEAFNECFKTGRALVQQGGVFKTTGRVSPTEAQAGTGNFDMPYSMFFGNVVIDYHGVGGTAFEIKNTVSQKSIADGLLLGSLEVINSGSGQYGIVLDGLNFWQVGKIKAGAAGKTFSERGVLIKSNNGKGGLWSSYQHVIGYGGKTAVEIGQTANANQFGRVWTGYSSEKCFINAGARNTFNLLSLEFLAASDITHGAFISAPCLINGYEAESDGTPGNFVSSIFINTTQPVLVNQASFVGHSPRYSWIAGAKLVLWPARTSTELASKLEIITSDPLEIADSVTPKKAIRNLVTVDSNNGGVPGTFGSYLSLLTTSFSGTLDLSGVLVNNNTTANLDMQIRFTDFEGVDSTSRTINIPAGQTLRLNQSDFIECLDPDKRYYLLKARFRPSAGITGTATITSVAFRM